ncbi:MAG: ABC transporter permease [Rhodospirillales bacterium]|nr:ABC transporter permease [Rhodospirillales bacterium]
MPKVLSRLVQTRELTLLIVILLIIAIMSQMTPYFFSMANFRAISIGFAPTAIIVVGMSILLVSGGFDLSVGSTLALCGTVSAMLLVDGVPIPVAMAAAVACGAMIGLINGFVVTKLGVNPLVATLGTMSLARGIALVLTEGFSISKLPKSYGFVGANDWLGVPLVVWIMVVIVLIGDIALRHTRVLRQVYFVGANEISARLSGISISKVRISAYLLTGVMAALAGLLVSSRLMAGTPTAGSGLELQVLAAAVIGGSSLRGGEGTVLGAFLGVVFMALISNAMTMLAVSIYWQMVVTGLILVMAVALDALVRRRGGGSSLN